MLQLDKSAIYRAGVDEEYYWSNLLYDLIRDWSFSARIAGTEALQYIEKCNKSETLEDQRFFAYFAGVAARRAFSIASRILALDEERQKYRKNKPINWMASTLF